MSYALFSGGHDSLAATHYAMEKGDAQEVVHLDTNTGIPQNLQFVRDVADEFGWPLRVEAAPVTLYEFAVQYGFPGSGAHSWAYRYLKHRQMRRIAREHDDPPVYVTGVRKFESDRRMRTVDGEEQEGESWWWEAPLYDKRDEWVDDYIQDHGLPTNPVVETLHRSGECNCGAYANRQEELAMLEAHYPEFAEWLLALEGWVQMEIGQEDPYCWWGHSGMPSNELRALMAEHDSPQMTLCESCSIEGMSA